MCHSEEEVAGRQGLLSRISPSITGGEVHVPETGTPFKCHEISAGAITPCQEDWVPGLVKLRLGAIWTCGHVVINSRQRGDSMEKTRRETNMNRMQQKLFNGTDRAWGAGVKHMFEKVRMCLSFRGIECLPKACAFFQQ